MVAHFLSLSLLGFFLAQKLVQNDKTRRLKKEDRDWKLE